MAADYDEIGTQTPRLRWWSETEHDQECSNGGCPGYEYHRAVLFGSSEESDGQG